MVTPPEKREIKIIETGSEWSRFDDWYRQLTDSKARKAVHAGIIKLANPMFRNFQSVGEGVFELKIFFGPGYRVYFGFGAQFAVILFAGGDKSTQQKDIRYAKALWKKHKNEINRHFRKFDGGRS